MESNANNQPPSAGSYGSFASARQDENEVSEEAVDGNSPNQPRVLFQRNGALPNLPAYLRHYIDASAAPLDLTDVDADAQDIGGNDDDSVESSDEAQELTNALVETARERNTDDDDAVPFTNDNSIPGLQPDVNVPKAPEDYVPAPVKTEQGEPEFESVDNPGNWNRYCFAPTFNKQKQYAGHQLPTGIRPCPAMENGVRESQGWVFFYKNWKIEDAWKSDGPFASLIGQVEDVPSYRSGAALPSLLPESRKGRLDYKLLKQLGLSKTRLLRHDPLFFYQLLLPICRIDKSDVQNDPRKPYYSSVMSWSQKYAFEMGLGGSYGHRFKEIMIPELVRFDGVLIRDGVLNGSTDGALYRRWDRRSSAFDTSIKDSLCHTRFLQLKRTLKLCDNSAAPKKGEDGYDPAYKYNFIYDTIHHNIRAVTEKASLDLCGDETSWAHQGFGEPGAGIVGRIFNKPGITKGGQIVLLVDAYRWRPYAYVHRHKCHTGYTGWNKQGPLEVRLIMESIAPFVEGGNGDRVLWDVKPHSTWDNHFSGCQILDWLGDEGYGATMTCRRDRLPDKVPKRYFHWEGTKPGDKRAKVARFLEPVTAVKIAKRKGVSEEEETASSSYYTRVHVSMQSTSSTNFTTVNALNGVSNYIQVKHRGSEAKGTKRSWGIEMNQARELYLATYGLVDSVDAQIRRCNIAYRSFKYWHAPKNHALALAIVVAYGMYEECLLEDKAQAFWNLDDDEKKAVKKQALGFYEFREKLSLQALTYSPVNQFYPGDKNFREVTQMSMQRRADQQRKRSGDRLPKSDSGLITKEQFDDMQKKQRLSNTRFCGDLTKLKRHFSSKETVKHKLSCAVCGDGTWVKCAVCNVGLHDMNSKGDHAKKTCFIDYHDNCMFGLCRIDTPQFGKQKKDWTPATDRDKERHRAAIQRLASGAMSTRSTGTTATTASTASTGGSERSTQSR